MSYPPPPGLAASKDVSSSSNAQLHSSLPPRPPPPAAPIPSFAPAFSSPALASGAPGTAAYHAAASGGAVGQARGFSGTFMPRQVAGTSQGWQNHSPSVSGPPGGFSVQAGYAGSLGQQPQYGANVSQQAYQAPAQTPASTISPPQIRNPFPLPGHGFDGTPGRGRGLGRFQDPAVDPEMEAQIAQWQSAYAGKDAADQTNGRGGGRMSNRTNGQGYEGPASASGANAGPLGGRGDGGGSTQSGSVAIEPDGGTSAAAAATAKGATAKQKTVVRSGGGQTWTDSSLLEWDPAHFRIFVGNLAGEVTDDSLLKAFAKYSSVQKARVVRDKRTTKSKGYGFVSFSDGDDYFQAAKDMQGKYIGSHPVIIRRSTTEIRPVVPGDKKGKQGKGGKGAKGGGGGSAKTGAGVQKKPNKTKGGLRVLG